MGRRDAADHDFVRQSWHTSLTTILCSTLVATGLEAAQQTGKSAGLCVPLVLVLLQLLATVSLACSRCVPQTELGCHSNSAAGLLGLTRDTLAAVYDVETAQPCD